MKKIYLKRCQNFNSELKKMGLEKAMIGNPINIFYFTGLKITPYERFVSLIFQADKEGLPQIILPQLEMGLGKRNNLEEILHKDGEESFNCVLEALGNIKKVGLESNFFPLSLALKFNKYLQKVKLEDITDIISALRAKKDKTEINNILEANKVADRILKEITETILKPGISEKELLAAVFQKMAQIKNVNIDSYVIQILVNERTANPHGFSEDVVLKNNSPAMFDYGACYNGYWSDFCRTFSVGTPLKEIEKIYPIVLEAQMAAIDAVKPGVAIKEIDLAARKVIEKSGFGEFFIHRTGHGLGLEIHEDPYIHKNNEDVLEVGHVFTIEPGIYLPNIGGVRIENDIAVTQTGYQDLTGYTKNWEAMLINA